VGALWGFLGFPLHVGDGDARVVISAKQIDQRIVIVHELLHDQAFYSVAFPSFQVSGEAFSCVLDVKLYGVDCIETHIIISYFPCQPVLTILLLLVATQRSIPSTSLSLSLYHVLRLLSWIGCIKKVGCLEELGNSDA
jgi:hypothetical protein